MALSNNQLGSAPTTIISTTELIQLRDDWEAAGLRVAFVPTMGALHEGHLSLALQAKKLADRVLVSIFVNPTQFGPKEDFSRYPRTLKEDLELLSAAGVEAVFLPSAASMYPEGFQTAVINKALATDLCGASRPGHFEGVLTVVLKLFNLAQPHVAVFGKKDYQQWRLIARMVDDLNLRIHIVGGETIRDADGLAKSSRNRYLLDTERITALKISQSLTAAKALYNKGERRSAAIIAAFNQVATPIADLALEYVELREQSQLTPFGELIDKPAVLLVAGRVGSTRLIDNMELP